MGMPPVETSRTTKSLRGADTMTHEAIIRAAPTANKTQRRTDMLASLFCGAPGVAHRFGVAWNFG
jgi:hypothetical protein